MKLKKYFAIFPLAFASLMANAEENTANKGSVFHFSTNVNRTVEKDLMRAELYSRKSGKNLAEMKKTVSSHLNHVLEVAKKYPAIEISANGVSNHPDYDNKGKVIGWVTEGHLSLQSKDFEAMAKVLEDLGNDVAIDLIDFEVSTEKMASLEDEMTLEIIKQFQHKAEVIQKGLNAKGYTLSDIQLNTPNGMGTNYPKPRMMKAVAFSAAADSSEQMPMEAGKTTISATASGKVVFE